EPAARFLDDAGFHAHIDQFAFFRNADTVEDVEIDGFEGRGDFVFDYFHPRQIADDFFFILQRADAADVEPHRGVEFQRVAAGGGFGVAEHHTDFLADLVDEDDGAAGTADGGRQLA